MEHKESLSMYIFMVMLRTAALVEAAFWGAIDGVNELLERDKY